MSLYGDYIKERENFDIVEDERGFATYLVQGEECYVRDVYVKPQHRKDHVAWGYMEIIRKRMKHFGVKTIITSVCTKANGTTTSQYAILSYGFVLSHTDGPMIYYRKEI